MPKGVGPVGRIPDAVPRGAGCSGPEPVAAVNGWVDRMGPCYAHTDRAAAYRRIKGIAASQAFDELPSRAAIESRWRRADERWQAIRQPHAAEMPDSQVLCEAVTVEGDFRGGEEAVC